ncbi:hypothetical protein B0H17DRAFT_1128725 [Mycena rosella]|uniref:Uncharacterized protein n=1 Tax=Mycena rosella TaxID=1033263 RepID=A0AAD7GLQ1_MYCRO|nr:hypothetical protein B0H17DRAFT_1128725 [Mycena rosella]
MAPFFAYSIHNPPDALLSGRFFDDSWLAIDTALWKYSHALDRQDGKGAVAAKFGLLDPADPERATSMETMLNKIRAQIAERCKAVAAPAPSASVQDPRPVASQPPGALSGHTYMMETKHMRAKVKVKTRGGASNEETTKNDIGADEEEDEEILPDALPKEFKIGKKVLKIFHRILQAPDDPSEIAGEKGKTVGVNKGQVRWAEFERECRQRPSTVQAMKRIGFGVCQTAGSSVRFDPPAKTARPITFHRYARPYEDIIILTVSSGSELGSNDVTAGRPRRLNEGRQKVTSDDICTCTQHLG